MSVTDLSGITLEETDVPTDVGDELLCEVCGTELVYGGRGRKPKRCEEHKRPSSASTRGVTGSRASGGVKQAADALDGMYSLLGMGLYIIGATNAATDLAASAEDLRAKNLKCLAQDPALVKLINKSGAVGGRLGFFSAQAMVLVPVAITAVTELSARRGSDE